jgi:DNA-binding transcriptional LysR family regulator
VLTDSSLIAVPVGHTRRIVCASPAYLTKSGRPKRPQDLAHHRCLRFIDGGSWKVWELRSGRKTVRVPVEGPFDTNLRDAQIAASVRGLGCAQVLEYQVAEQLRSGALERLLEADEPPAVPIHVVYPHARLLSARVRVVIDFLVGALRASGASRSG